MLGRAGVHVIRVTPADEDGEAWSVFDAGGEELELDDPTCQIFLPELFSLGCIESGTDTAFIIRSSYVSRDKIVSAKGAPDLD